MQPKLRDSRVLKKLRAGETAYSFKLNFSCAREAELVSMFGFDCIWSDAEHVPNDLSVVEKQVWAAKINDTDVMVRVSKGSYNDYIKPLELDAAGIMVPHVMSGEEARNIVHMTRFHPMGRRPIDGGNADGKFCSAGMVDYIQHANEQRFVIVQIEDPEGIENIEDIAEVPGIDMLFFGPGDYSHGLGIPGQMDHQDIKDARQKVVDTALSHGKFAGTVGKPDVVNDLVDMGYRFINVGGDVSALNTACGDLAEALHL